MKLRADLLALLLAGLPGLAAAAPLQGLTGSQEPHGTGPRRSSEPGGGEVRVDVVAEAAVVPLPGVTVAVTGLTAGDTAEVTSLESGRTILARVTDSPELALSRGAAAALGVAGPRVAVRVRRTVAAPQEISALLRGEAAPVRPDAPPALLEALRRKLPPTIASAPSTPLPAASRPNPRVAGAPPAPSARVQPTTAPRTGPGVQVAALSDPGRARALADTLGGRVVSAGGLHRVQLGPFATAAQARAAQASAARRGYPDARVITVSRQ